MKIICIGRNYANHAKEMNSAILQEPVFFLKPDTAILPKRHPFYLPDFTQDLQYEVEIVVKINKLGKNIDTAFAHTYYDSIGIGIDFTARDLQQRCKEKGLPWEIAKAFDYSAPISQQFLPVSDFENIHDIPFSLKKNSTTVQEATTADMLFNIDQLISYVSRFITLKIGDLIFTGTPAGVGSVHIGDTLQAYIGQQEMLKLIVK